MHQIGDVVEIFIDGLGSFLGLIIHIDLQHRPSYMIYSAGYGGTIWMDETDLSDPMRDGNDILKGML